MASIGGSGSLEAGAEPTITPAFTPVAAGNGLTGTGVAAAKTTDRTMSIIMGLVSIGSVRGSSRDGCSWIDRQT
jgi:hypothetical protein